MISDGKEYLLLTGATSGVGKILSNKLADKYNLIIHGRDNDKLELLKQDILDKGHREPLIWNQDFNAPEEIDSSLTKVLATKCVLIRKFVHCSGYFKMAPLRMTSCDSFYKHFNVNVIAAAEIVKVLFCNKVNEKTLDSVIFISSSISNRGAKAFSAYGASKAALDGLMRNLSIELAPKVRVNSVLPGGMKTKMTEKIMEQSSKNIFEKYPLGMGTPEKLTGIVEFLLSEEASWITGQQFVVDGGRTIDITD